MSTSRKDITQSMSWESRRKLRLKASWERPLVQCEVFALNRVSEKQTARHLRHEEPTTAGASAGASSAHVGQDDAVEPSLSEHDVRQRSKDRGWCARLRSAVYLSRY